MTAGILPSQRYMSVQSDDTSPDNDHDQAKYWSKFMPRLLHLLPNADFGTHSTSYTQVKARW